MAEWITPESSKVEELSNRLNQIADNRKANLYGNFHSLLEKVENLQVENERGGVTATGTLKIGIGKRAKIRINTEGGRLVRIAIEHSPGNAQHLEISRDGIRNFTLNDGKREPVGRDGNTAFLHRFSNEIARKMMPEIRLFGKDTDVDFQGYREIKSMALHPAIFNVFELLKNRSMANMPEGLAVTGSHRNGYLHFFIRKSGKGVFLLSHPDANYKVQIEIGDKHPDYKVKDMHDLSPSEFAKSFQSGDKRLRSANSKLERFETSVRRELEKYMKRIGWVQGGGGGDFI